MISDDISLLPLDISDLRSGNIGTYYVHQFDSGYSGPNVLVNALTHGNEICGAHALATFISSSVRPIRGVLNLSFANVAAYETFDPSNPHASRCIDEDMNRIWSKEILDSERTSAELERARELRAIVSSADRLLDIHSMHTDGPALLLSGNTPKGKELAYKVSTPKFIVADSGHASGARMRDYGNFSVPAAEATALLVECGQHWRIQTRDTAIKTLFNFLQAVGTITPDAAEFYTSSTETPMQRLIEVTETITVTNSDFTFVKHYSALEVVANKGTVIGIEGGKPITTPYDNCVLVMAASKLQKGQTAVRLGRLVTSSNEN